LGVLLELAEGGMRLNGVRGGDSVGHLGWLLVAGLVFWALTGCCVLAYFLWGRYSIAVRGPRVVLFRGVGNIGMPDVFSTAEIKEVRVERLVRNEVEEHVIRIVGGSQPFEFGNSLTSVQRTWIALFLLEFACAV
jgi:hypothetical protein